MCGFAMHIFKKPNSNENLVDRILGWFPVFYLSCTYALYNLHSLNVGGTSQYEVFLLIWKKEYSHGVKCTWNGLYG
jgi:hypothetical protein